MRNFFAIKTLTFYPLLEIFFYMKISIFSDPHCGFEERGREEDSFIALSEAMEKSLGSDLILIAGDLFDSRVPKQEVLAKVAKILSKAHHFPGRARMVKVINKDKEEISPLALRGTPVIVIHGNHERRSRQLLNPVQALEHAGLVINLHCSTIVFEIDGAKVAIHGMGNVPERYAKDAFLAWNPQPVKDALNILMLHQSVGDYIYSPLEPPTLQLEHLPDGFDLYVLGHLHWHEVRNFRTGKLLLPGSLIPAYPRKDESGQKKGVWFYDGKNLEFSPLSFQREIFFRDFEHAENVKEEIDSYLSSLPEGSIVKISVKGEGSGTTDFKDIVSKFESKLVVKIKNEIRAPEIEEKIKLLEMIREKHLSPEELGMAMLRKNLEKLACPLRVEEIFDLLVNGEVESALAILKGEQKTLFSAAGGGKK